MSGREVVAVRGDADDVFSKGFLCPKATGLEHLQADPDRLRAPLVKQPDGTFAEAGWDEALEIVDARLSPLLAEHGRNAVAVYVGNPNAHNLSALTYGPVWLRALGSRNVYTATTVDQMPKHISAGLMFGSALSIPVPDVDRTDHLHDPGRQPAGVQRQPAHRARHARPAAPHPRAWREGRGDRPAPHPHGGGGRRAPLHPPRR